MKYIICHYGEIGLKGKNRKFFEEQLIINIKLALKGAGFECVKRISGRILIKLKNDSNWGLIKEKLKKVFGIVNFSLAVCCQPDIEEIKKTAFELLSDRKFKTFKIEARRADKKFYLTSQQINELVGEYIRKELKKKVDLENPDITCFVEIVEQYAFLYIEKISGSGGLPVGVSGKAVVLLSGGIDSPVASWYSIKRGLKVVFLHFHAYPYTNKSSIEKVNQIVNILKEYQPNSRLYLVPFGEIQKNILLNTPASLRVILYRRFMVRIAKEVAKKEKAKAIVTGENLGQVASQTIENISVVEEAVNLPILRPLIGFDKQEIIKKAKEIDTFDISILPDQDCCSRFLPQHPSTKADLKEIKNAEKKLNIKSLIKEALKRREVVYFK